MPRRYAQEEDVLVFVEPNGKRQYLYVYQTEDVQYEDRTTWKGTVAKAVTTAALTTTTQMTAIEPDEKSLPEVQIYQLRAGIRGPVLAYVELNAGVARRGTWKAPKPSSTNYWVGHLTQEQSPAEDPKFEMWLKHGQYPAFAMYNPTELRKAEAILAFVGKKLACFDLEHSNTPKAIGLEPAQVQNILQRLKSGNYPHRAITVRGLT